MTRLKTVHDRISGNLLCETDSDRIRAARAAGGAYETSTSDGSLSADVASDLRSQRERACISGRVPGHMLRTFLTLPITAACSGWSRRLSTRTERDAMKKRRPRRDAESTGVANGGVLPMQRHAAKPLSPVVSSKGVANVSAESQTAGSDRD